LWRHASLPKLEVTLSNVLTSILNQKKNAPQVISPPIQQLFILSDGQISRLVAHVAGNFAPFGIGAAHIVSKTGQAAYGEFIIVARAAAESARTPAAHSALWIERVFLTAPADPGTIEEAIKGLYRAANLAAPRGVLSQLQPAVLDVERRKAGGEYRRPYDDMEQGEPWRFLQMVNQSIGAVQIEAMPRECGTVGEALNWRRSQNIDHDPMWGSTSRTASE
jgi:hypothetical protein